MMATKIKTKIKSEATKKAKERRPNKLNGSARAKKITRLSKKSFAKAKKNEALAVIRYIHIAPKKMRAIANLVRGLKLEEAENILRNVSKRAAVPVMKAIRSASANAENNYQLDKKSLKITRISIDQSISLPRFRPRAQGRAFKIQKKFSHINVVLTEVTQLNAAKANKRMKAKKVKPISSQTASKKTKGTGRASKLKRPLSVITKTKMK